MIREMLKDLKDEALLRKIGRAIQILQANGFDLGLNLKKGVYEIIAKGDTETVFETFDDYQQIIDHAQTLPIQEINDAKVNLN